MVMSKLKFLPNSDDCIGTESCMDFQNPNDILDNHWLSKFNYVGNETKANSDVKKKENKVLPPPISLLARTQNHTSLMPWILKRHYTSEGRLILKVKHHEYFRTHRANGRLTLQLVNVFFDDYDEYFEEAAPTSPLEEIDNDNFTHDHTDVITDNDRSENEENVTSIVTDELSVNYENDVDVVVAGCGRMKCLNHTGDLVRSSSVSNIFGMSVHPIRTVHG